MVVDKYKKHNITFNKNTLRNFIEYHFSDNLNIKMKLVNQFMDSLDESNKLFYERVDRINY